ncbi:MAG: hypothetical protein BECKG1743D_GA0114223_103197 [Candidatus Kentron sp. G]|nr:MAG: hypothetical protein BECKG1743F_GA0114225_101817 [Candidatus Kentron sp. G]VFM99316.1 MAG: hypothetical protein BECKG1743E_GA0114224_102488 [Candidatus Kentron sp. G]VFN01902.1 MAG: hypothetical protein BECKG1743D_GA0114223_103197 [Candidatus Kentron sp. G]
MEFLVGVATGGIVLGTGEQGTGIETGFFDKVIAGKEHTGLRDKFI